MCNVFIAYFIVELNDNSDNNNNNARGRYEQYKVLIDRPERNPLRRPRRILKIILS
jgi:hypothetical protein